MKGIELNPIKRRERLAKTAADLFIAASATYPASVLCQAVQITQEAEIEPRKLGKALLKSPEQQDRIKKAATVAHGHARAKKPEGTTNAPYALSEERVRSIILADFTFASKYRKVPKEKLGKLLDDYGKVGEDSLRSKANVYVKGHRNLRYRSLSKDIAF